MPIYTKLTVVVIIAVSTVSIYQFNRKRFDLERGDGARNDTDWLTTSTTNKRKRRRNKARRTRKTKVRYPDVTNANVIDLRSEEIEEVVAFERDAVPLQIDVGTVGSEKIVDILKPMRCQPNPFKITQAESIPITNPLSKLTDPAMNNFQLEA